jgi:hypothetical protein
LRTESSSYAVYQENLESIEYASDEELSRLKGVLKELKRNVTLFNQSYSVEFERLLAAGRTEGVTESPIGKAVEEAHRQRQVMKSFKFKELVEKVAVVSAKMQTQSLGEDYAIREDVSQESVLDLIAQVKSLKMSIVCNQKFGVMY